jgi:hypothetical protein
MTNNGKSAETSNTDHEAPTGARRDIATRFKAGNQSARRHGLRAGTRKELRRRDQRTSRLLSKYLEYRADQGRPLGPTQLPLARRFIELEVMATDTYAAWRQKPTNTKLHAMYISTTRALALLGSQLGESVATMARLKVADLIGGSSNGLAAQLARHRLTAPADGGA